MKTYTSITGQKVRADGPTDAIQKLAKKSGTVQAIHFHGFKIESGAESATVYGRDGEKREITIKR